MADKALYRVTQRLLASRQLHSGQTLSLQSDAVLTRRLPQSWHSLKVTRSAQCSMRSPLFLSLQFCIDFNFAAIHNDKAFFSVHVLSQSFLLLLTISLLSGIIILSSSFSMCVRCGAEFSSGLALPSCPLFLYTQFYQTISLQSRIFFNNSRIIEHVFFNCTKNLI